MPGRNLTTEWRAINPENYDDVVTNDSFLIVMQNYFLKSRLVITAGLRREQIDAVSPNTIRELTTQEWRLATPEDQPRFAGTGFDWVETKAEKGSRHSLGAVLHLTQNFSLTANASNGAGINNRNREVLPDHRVPDSSKGEGRDYGLSFSFLDNRISGSLKRYTSKSIQEVGSSLVAGVFVNPNNDVMSSFDRYYRDAGLTNLDASAPIKSIDDLKTTLFSTADGHLSNRVSKGYEFELVGNPTRNWSIRANYAYTERTRTNVLTEGEGWWAERLELFKKLDDYYIARTGRSSVYDELVFDRLDAFTNVRVAQRIADSDRELAAVRFREQQGYANRKHKANLWTRYMLTQGKLNGLTVGGGWRYQSANMTGINLRTRELYFGNARSLFDGMLSYRTKGLFGRFGDKVGVTYQLNVTNLLDDRTINILKVATDNVTNIPYVSLAMREDPRVTTLTVRLAF